jgi:hypothetical protein
MAKKTADQIAQKYTRGVSGAGQDYAAGVQNPSRPWASSTVAGAARWQAGIQLAISNKSFQNGVSKAGDAKWQSAAINKGAQRYQSAATEAGQAYAQQAGKVMSAAAAAQAAVQSMPNETMEQRIARSAAAQRAISAAWGKGTK